MRATLRPDRGHPGRVWRQRVEDNVRGLDRPGGSGWCGWSAATDIVVAPGETARLSVTVGTDARADLAVGARLIGRGDAWGGRALWQRAA